MPMAPSADDDDDFGEPGQNDSDDDASRKLLTFDSSKLRS